MTKNTFRFSCALKSEYNYEALNFNEREYFELIPIEYIEENKSNHKYTRNPDILWAKP